MSNYLYIDQIEINFQMPNQIWLSNSLGIWERPDKF